MKRTADYTNLTGSAKQKAAILDILEYTSPSLFRRILRALNEEPLTEESIRCYFSMLGIEGYPVTAFLERYAGRYFQVKVRTDREIISSFGAQLS